MSMSYILEVASWLAVQLILARFQGVVSRN